MARPVPTNVVTACESCRSRKVKCDKKHPRCRSCEKHGFECVFLHERVKKGPRKGELGRLKAQVAILEQKLAMQHAVDQLMSPTTNAAASDAVATIQPETAGHVMQQTSTNESENVHMHLCTALEPGLSPGSSENTAWADPEFLAWLDLTPSSTELTHPMDPRSRDSSIWNMGQSELGLDKLVKADLEATYFERSHPFMPLLHRERFHSWADSDTVTPAQECLRSAVWTVAAALCPRFHNLYESLYVYTTSRLQNLDDGYEDHLWMPLGSPQLEKVQAWLLIGHCDFIQHGPNVATLSASRICRLVQAACYNMQYGGDRLTYVAEASMLDITGNTEEATLVEEKGRTFWVAFSFDRLAHSVDHYGFALPDESAHLPLPCPDPAYQAAQPHAMDTLLQALEGPEVDTGSHFAESIISITLYGRCLTHRRLAIVAKACDDSILLNACRNSERTQRHAWLRHSVDLRLKSRTQAVTASTPLLALAYLLNLCCVVHLFETLEQFSTNHIDEVDGAYDAAVKIAQFTNTLPRAACFKTHPLVPVILTQAFAFTTKYRKLLERNRDPTSIDQVSQCLVLQLQKFEDVHIIAKEFMEKHKSGAW